MKRILITGAGGFIGRELVNQLSKNKKNKIIAVDNNIRGNLKSIDENKNIIVEKVDVRKKEKLRKIFKNIDECYHLAAINGTKNFYEKPNLVLDVGVMGTLNVIELVKEYKVKKFIYFSSSEAYQKPNFLPTTEREELKIPDVFNPRFSYGGSKIIGEMLTINYLRNSKTKYYILRPHNVYGPNMGGDHVLPELIRKLKKSNKFLKIVGDGNDSRSFIFISDAVNAIIKVANNGTQNQIYNIGSNDEYKITEIVRILCKILNKKIRIKKSPRHLGSVSKRLPDIKKLKKLKHKNKTNFIKGLRKTIDYYYFDEKQS